MQSKALQYFVVKLNGVDPVKKQTFHRLALLLIWCFTMEWDPETGGGCEQMYLLTGKSGNPISSTPLMNGNSIQTYRINSEKSNSHPSSYQRLEGKGQESLLNKRLCSKKLGARVDLSAAVISKRLAQKHKL